MGQFAAVDTAAEGIGLGLLGSLAFVVPTLVVNGMYQQRSWVVTWIDLSYNVVGFVVAGIILGAWT